MKCSALSAFGVVACFGLLTACANYGTSGDTEGGMAPVAANSRQTTLFSALDGNGDGVVSQDELINYFQAHDRTGDGELDASEFAAFEIPGLAGPNHPRGSEANGISRDFPQQLRNPEPTGPEVARPPALKERL